MHFYLFDVLELLNRPKNQHTLVHSHQCTHISALTSLAHSNQCTLISTLKIMRSKRSHKYGHFSAHTLVHKHQCAYISAHIPVHSHQSTDISALKLIRSYFTQISAFKQVHTSESKLVRITECAQIIELKLVRRIFCVFHNVFRNSKF